MIFGSLGASSPYVAIIILIVIGIWMVTTRILGRKIDSLAKGESDKKAKHIEPGNIS